MPGASGAPNAFTYWSSEFHSFLVFVVTHDKFPRLLIPQPSPRQLLLLLHLFSVHKLNNGLSLFRYALPSAPPRLFVIVFGICHNRAYYRHVRVVAVVRRVRNLLEPSQDGFVGVDEYQLNVGLAKAGAVDRAPKGRECRVLWIALAISDGGVDRRVVGDVGPRALC